MVSDFQSTPVWRAGVHSCSPVAPQSRVIPSPLDLSTEFLPDPDRIEPGKKKGSVHSISTLDFDPSRSTVVVLPSNGVLQGLPASEAVSCPS